MPWKQNAMETKWQLATGLRRQCVASDAELENVDIGIMQNERAKMYKKEDSQGLVLFNINPHSPRTRRTEEIIMAPS